MRDEDDQLYIYKLYGVSVPRRIKATKTLRSRIGATTKITEEQVEKAQDVIENPRSDYRLLAFQYIRKVEGAIEMARVESYLHDSEFDEIIVPLVKIKGEAGMFGNPLVSEMSGRIVKFIEHYRRLDEDMLRIIEVFCKMIRLAYDQNYCDINSQQGQRLSTELSLVMDRYVEKFRKKTGR